MSQPSLRQYDVRSHGVSHSRCNHAGRHDRQNLPNSKTAVHEDTLQTDRSGRKLLRLSTTTIGAANRTSLSYPTEELTSIAGIGGRRLPCHGLCSERPSSHKANDRQKKDMHNKVEQRRRTNINDRITELRTLLPENIGRTSSQKKGLILKESVDYIKKLKSDLCRLNHLEDQMKETNIEVQKLGFKVKHLELAVSPNIADNGGTYQVQNNTKAHESILNSRSTLAPVTGTKRDNSNSNSLEFRSDVFTALSQTLQSDGICVDSEISAPSSSAEDIDDFDCYL
ncbi:transcription factor EC-like [Mercenaria mercenaria]|uniref:transcription factor EC-like n=1 Tax=Mercenaria mercenaria TaxID=6596 RepID=UPI00234F665A|nr:transcription factor EC-like [Mercenaria mercenaria]